jgi:hypothetical protein
MYCRGLLNSSHTQGVKVPDAQHGKSFIKINVTKTLKMRKKFYM